MSTSHLKISPFFERWVGVQDELRLMSAGNLVISGWQTRVMAWAKILKSELSSGKAPEDHIISKAWFAQFLQFQHSFYCHWFFHFILFLAGISVSSSVATIIWEILKYVFTRIFLVFSFLQNWTHTTKLHHATYK